MALSLSLALMLCSDALSPRPQWSCVWSCVRILGIGLEIGLLSGLMGIPVALAQTQSLNPDPTLLTLDPTPSSALDSALLEASPTLRRWLEQPPDLLEEIRNRPLIQPRIQASLGTDTWSVGLEDLRLFDRLTVSGDYQQFLNTASGTEQQFGSSLRYYLAPLGSQVNVAPVVGYRHLEAAERSWGTVQWGAHAVLIPAPGAADLTLSYSWLHPPDESISTLVQLTTAYTLRPSFRMGARYRYESSRLDQETSFGLVVEWIP